MEKGFSIQLQHRKDAIPGFIKKFCTRNGLLTLAEYLEDYSSEETKKVGYDLIEREIEMLPGEEQKEDIRQRLERIKKGTRDILY